MVELNPYFAWYKEYFHFLGRDFGHIHWGVLSFLLCMWRKKCVNKWFTLDNLEEGKSWEHKKQNIHYSERWKHFIFKNLELKDLTSTHYLVSIGKNATFTKSYFDLSVLWQFYSTHFFLLDAGPYVCFLQNINQLARVCERGGRCNFKTHFSANKRTRTIAHYAEATPLAFLC